MKKKLQQLLVILFVPIFLIIIFIRPIIHIRWCTNYFSDRIGHLVSEMEHYFLFKKKIKKKVHSIYFLQIYFIIPIHQIYFY